MPNRLAAESSPYLQQHAGNPVDWFPWGSEAFAAARRDDRPVLLSIGYAACHWCHVMAHESFEDATTARLMNERFVNVKVDREERPDVDSIYMQAVQAIAGHGGWPMTVFLTPDGVPFYGGTYYPPEDRHGMPSFRRVLVSVSEAWRTRRDEVLKGATTLRGIYDAAEATTQAGKPLLGRHVAEAISDLRDRFDVHEGGFGGAPKFPQPQLLDLLMHHWTRTGEEEWIRLVRHTWSRMADGGLHDQLGGGFHRYTVDGRWMVPHFEKMLYDNALLARLGVLLWQADRDPGVRQVVEGILSWVRREMTDPAGGWYSSLDADSEGEEGRFYVWSREELRALLGPGAAIAEAHWGVTAEGNFEGSNILHVARSVAEAAAACGMGEAEAAAAIADARARLLEARARRVRPARDEKVLTAWNGLMLRAMADAARAFGDRDLATAALRAGAFLAREMRHEGRLMRSWREGRASIPAFLEDHAALGLGFIALYQLTFDGAWLDRALALDAACVRWFWDENAGAFFDTAHDAEPLVTRPRDVADNAMPSGTSLAVELQLLAAEYTGDERSRRRVEYVLSTLATPMRRSPMAFGHLLGVADRAVNGTLQLAIVGDPDSAPFRALARVAAETCLPQLVLAGGEGTAAADRPLLAGRTAPAGTALAYVCRGSVCGPPVATADDLARALRDLMAEGRRQ